nr:hypothetical protein [Dietzia maris]
MNTTSACSLIAEVTLPMIEARAAVKPDAAWLAVVTSIPNRSATKTAVFSIGPPPVLPGVVLSKMESPMQVNFRSPPARARSIARPRPVPRGP